MWTIIKSCLGLSLVFYMLQPLEATHEEKTSQISCKDEQGNDVDWFYLYKLPKHYAQNRHMQDTSGLHYMYVTSRSLSKWHLSTISIDAPTSLPGLTLAPLFEQIGDIENQKLLLLAYNDEFPNNTVHFSGGHTKGVLAADEQTAIWLIHSVPKFPALDVAEYSYPPTGAHYAQSMLCLTLPVAQLQNVGKQLLYNEPNFYYAQLPANMQGKYPNLEQAMAHDWPKQAPHSSILDLQTIAGNKFKSFAKTGKYGKDLYEDLIAPVLNVNLMVETWRNGAGNLPSNCSRQCRVYNVARIKERELHIDFRTTNDHSKWAVSEATGFKLWRWRIGGSDWICVGDINRQMHQLQRGGGSVCLKHSKVTGLYRDLVSAYDPCEALILAQ